LAAVTGHGLCPVSLRGTRALKPEDAARVPLQAIGNELDAVSCPLEND